MATLVLSAAGAAIGGAVGGSVLGLSSVAIGKAIGATIGSSIDQKLLGSGSAPVETGRVDNFRVMGASEGAPVAQVYGQMRTPAQVIWSSRFLEKKTESKQGSKGNRTTVVAYSYSVSLALALCEGEITKVGRVWADGNEISLENVEHRVYRGDEEQLPDALIEAIEGQGNVPAYRGTAYIVMENLELGPFGNRIPQFNFEVVRRVKELGANPEIDPFDVLNGVALIPGTGEYALATTPVKFDFDKGVSRSANQNSISSRTDFEVAIDQLKTDLPRVNAVSMVVSWFGDDLRCSACRLRPKVEQSDVDGDTMAWRVSGDTRATAAQVSRIDGNSVFGGTACDASVVEAIQKLKSEGQDVMFYPFILMDIIPGNDRVDPYTGNIGQPVFPWRGRITLSMAPGQQGSPDKTAQAREQVDALIGQAQVSDFSRSEGRVDYTGPQEWSYRRFILHYAHLCAEAGGVGSFIIGSELRGLTQIRDENNAFPFVEALVALADDVRSIVGPETKVSYAADWSEYFGYQPGDGSGDVFFHLDPLWGSSNIDFVGIDNYMPLSDWRDSSDHLDAEFGSIYDLTYLESNVAGGEGYDWYYASTDDREFQIRRPISDGAYGEHWIYRYKDLRSWWSNAHHDRPGGIRDEASTAWVPQSKPFIFTEFGCPAIDKGTNQPNVFVDKKSSENHVPYHSTGARDDFIQYRYFQAHLNHWAKPENNPVSLSYGQPMVDMSKAYIWAFDTRPWPDFPARSEVWSDGENYERGHWVSGRVGAATLAAVVTQIAARSEFHDVDVSQLHGLVRGYAINDTQTARQSIQPLMLSYGFDSGEVDGNVVFRSRLGSLPVQLDAEEVKAAERGEAITFARAPRLDVSSQVTVSYYQSEGSYQVGAASASIPELSEPTVTSVEVPVALSSWEGASVAARFLSETKVARDEVTFTLPPSMLHLTSGDIVTFTSDPSARLYRIDRLEETGGRECRAVRVEHGVYQRGGSVERAVNVPLPSLRTQPYIEFLDLPLITGDELPYAPQIAATSVPWTGPLSIYTSATDSGYVLNERIAAPSVMGTTLNAFVRQDPGRWALAGELLVRLPRGELESMTPEQVLSGGNLAAVRASGAEDWELLQFLSAELVDVGEYRLTGFLRGQLGTDAVMPDVHPAGSDFVLLDGSSVQPNLPASARGLTRHYRIGPALRPYDDPSYAHFAESFIGVGLRPYAPAHFRAWQDATGNIDLSWIRRTRIDGESWEGEDVPLGEEQEAYLLRILSGQNLVREEMLFAPNHLYTAAQRAADAHVGPIYFEVAQVSAQFGPGPFERMTFNG